MACCGKKDVATREPKAAPKPAQAKNQAKDQLKSQSEGSGLVGSGVVVSGAVGSGVKDTTPKIVSGAGKPSSETTSSSSSLDGVVLTQSNPNTAAPEAIPATTVAATTVAADTVAIAGTDSPAKSRSLTSSSSAQPVANLDDASPRAAGGEVPVVVVLASVSSHDKLTVVDEMTPSDRKASSSSSSSSSAVRETEAIPVTASQSLYEVPTVVVNEPLSEQQRRSLTSVSSDHDGAVGATAVGATAVGATAVGATAVVAEAMNEDSSREDTEEETSSSSDAKMDDPNLVTGKESRESVTTSRSSSLSSAPEDVTSIASSEEKLPREPSEIIIQIEGEKTRPRMCCF